jgi:hypothetical protein
MGDYPGRFYEDWLDVGQRLRTEAAEAAMELETRARTAARHLPVVVVRHALLVGERRTGHIECGAGLAKLFAAGPLLGWLPTFVPIPGLAEGPRFVNVSPVDYVAEGIVEIAASDLVRPGNEGATYCLADARPPTLAELWDLLLDRVGAGEAWLRIPVDGRGPLGRTLHVAGRLGTTVARLFDRTGGLPSALSQRGEHDVRNAVGLLEPVHIACPRLETYLDALYSDYLARRKRSS